VDTVPHSGSVYVAGSNPGVETFPTLIALNYTLTITQANKANRPFGLDTLTTAGAEVKVLSHIAQFVLL